MSLNIAENIVKKLKSILPNKDFIALHEPIFLGNEEKYVSDCIKTGWVSSVGSYVDRFEKAITNYVGCKYAVSTVNGTNALHLALETLGVKQDEEVLLPSMTFIATANSISYCKAIPHFVEVEKQSFAIDADKLSAYLANIVNFDGKFSYNKITKRKISALIIMHCFGMPAKDIEKIQDIAKKYNLFLIEDAAESLGSFYKNIHTGNFSDIATFSFNGNKIITTGGGGMLVTNNKNYADKARHLATTGKIIDKYQHIHDVVAYNYRMPNINAALGLAQLEQINNFLKQKRTLAKKYQEIFAKDANIKFLSEAKDSKSNYWLNCLILKDDSQLEYLLIKTNEAGIMTRMIWQPLHQSIPYKNCPKMNLEVTEEYSKKILNIPSSANLIS